MIPASVMQWLSQYARPSAIMELYETFSDRDTLYDLNAADQLRVLYHHLTGESIDEATAARDAWFRDHTTGGFTKNFDQL